MDDLECQGEVVHQTLRELEFINQWLGGNAITLSGIKSLVKGHEKETLTIADLGCGSGDILRLLADWGRKNKYNLKLTGIDANPYIIEFAKQQHRDYQEISFESINVLSPEFQARKFDIVTGTLFYHHFHSDVLVEIFSQLKKQTRIGLLINDIHRHWFAFHSIRLLTRYFSRSAMVKFDAPLSVLRAFSRKELEVICSRAGLEHYQLRWKWAFRWQLLAQF